MKPTQAFKQTLLRRMLFGLRLSAASPSPTLHERKAAVRLAADAAMASARGAGRRWTHALASRLLRQDRRCGRGKRSFARIVLGEQFVGLLAEPTRPTRSKKIVRRSLAVCSAAVRRKRKEEGRAKRRRTSSCSSVEKRTRALRRLVPGGEAMNGLSLLDESLDYVVALRTQADLMQSLLTALEEASKRRGENGCTILAQREPSSVGE